MRECGEGAWAVGRRRGRDENVVCTHLPGLNIPRHANTLSTTYEPKALPPSLHLFALEIVRCMNLHGVLAHYWISCPEGDGDVEEDLITLETLKFQALLFK